MPELYTVKEASKILKTNIHKVYDLIDAGLLPAIKLGRTKIREESIKKFIEKYEGMDLTNLDEIKDLND